MSDLPDIQPDAARVIDRLQARLGEALGQIVMLEDVVGQLQTERAKAILPQPPAGAA